MFNFGVKNQFFVHLVVHAAEKIISQVKIDLGHF